MAAGACDANFFDTKSSNADMLLWLDHEEDGGINNNCGGMVLSPTAAATNGMVVKKDRIGIYDATNSTRERRMWILKECTCKTTRAGKPTVVVYVESICDDKDLLYENYMTKVTNSPDYAGMDTKTAMADIIKRAALYEEAYETIDDDSLSYIKLYNLSSKMLVNHIGGRIAKSIVPALMAWNIGTRPVFICRAGETMDVEERKTQRRIMSRSESLGPKGVAFRDELFDYMRDECLDFIHRRKQAAFNPSQNTGTGTSINGNMNRSIFKSNSGNLDFLSEVLEEVGEEEDVYLGIDGVTPLPFPCYIMSSTMPRARQTVAWEGMPYSVKMMSNLNPLDKGDFTGKELEDIAVEHPDWYEELVLNPFHTRFPGGECYGDLTSRLESVVVDIEQQVGPVLVVSHISILQVLVAYFRATPVEECTSIALPMNTVIKFTPSKGGGWQESRACAVISSSGSHCDLQSMDDTLHWEHKTPVGMSMEKRVMKKDCQPEDVGTWSVPSAPLIPNLPIWGDHCKSSSK